MDEGRDVVNHPEHYTSGPIECLDAIAAMLGSYNFQSYLRGQVVKYAWRMDKKGRPLEDARKAQFYLSRLVKSLEADVS